MKQKYVIGLALQDINNRRLECILFAETMTHKDAAELFQFGEDVVSAGFFDLHYNGPQDLSGDGTVMTAGSIAATVHGRSETLDIGGQSPATRQQSDAGFLADCARGDSAGIALAP